MLDGGKLTWAPDVIEDLMKVKLPPSDQLIRELCIRWIDCSSQGVMNEFLDFIEKKISDECGLERLEFDSFPSKEFKFEPTILQRFSDKAKNMHTLMVSKMVELNPIAQGQLTYMVAESILESTRLETLDLTNLGGSAAEGLEVLEALTNSSCENLKNLSLGNNKKWFKEPVKAEMVASFIEQQTQLEIVALNGNRFGSEGTLLILKAISNGRFLGSSLLKLDLRQSSWDHKESAFELAKITAYGIKMKQIQINGQIGEKNLMIERKMADKGKPGVTRIKELSKNTNEERIIKEIECAP